MNLQSVYDLINTRIPSPLAGAVNGGGSTPSRDTAPTINQTINSSGSVTQVVYTFSTGTITDTYTYGANSTKEPTVVNLGEFVPN